ncbi:MAG: hypothetical protein AB1486_16810 [Planctomycetota bacterium]
MAVFALLLTAGELRDEPSTPLTFLVATLVPGVLAVQSRRAVHAEVMSFGLVATAWVYAIYAVPETGKPFPEILPLLGAIAGVLATMNHAVSLGIGQAAAKPAALDLISRLRRVATVVALLGIAVLLANLVIMGARLTDLSGVVLGFACGLLGALVFFWLARNAAQPVFLRFGVASLVVLYAFLANRSELLSLLKGYHFHAMVVFGAGFMMLGDGAAARFKKAFMFDGLLLPLPGLVLSLIELSASGAAVLFLAAVAYGLAYLRSRHAALGIFSLVLVNLAIFTLWQHHGFVDPALYGVPAGLTLLLGAELARGRLAVPARTLLVAGAFALVYGSVAVQVFRVEEPLHAIVLFGIGLIGVVGGLLLRRNSYLVAGTAAVVLDVVAYLARHGLERDFLGAVLLVTSGVTLLVVGAIVARRRRRGLVVAAPRGSPGDDVRGGAAGIP